MNVQMKIIIKKNVYSREKSRSYVVPFPTINVAYNKPTVHIVKIRVTFIRIGDIDTLNEKYEADIYYEARWVDTINLNSLNLTSQQESQLLNDSMPVRLSILNPKLHWTPQLFIENAKGQITEQDAWCIIKKSSIQSYESASSSLVRLDLCESRRVKGVFWERLELDHFPADVQDLTVSISTHHHIDYCLLVPDDKFRSGINYEAFFDQQEWKLYKHVAIEVRQAREEYSFDNENNELIVHKIRPIVSVACRAARYPGYFYWNGFGLIFLITVCSFCTFSITADLPQNRLSIACTLLLASITFRWVVNRSLPTISYLTSLDKYAIASILHLILLCAWHSIISTLIFLNPSSAQSRIIQPTNFYVYVDRYVFIGLLCIYTIIQIFFIAWLILVPYKRRREMQYLDREYAANKYIELDTEQRGINTIQNHF